MSCFLLIVISMVVCGQNNLNANGDNLIGNYLIEHGKDVSKVRFTKADDGTYTCQVYYLRDNRDKRGNVILDVHNPDKSLRGIPCDRIVLIRGLKYNDQKQQWDGAKIYDPTRGLKANVTASFAPDGRHRLRGQVLGIGETLYWKRIE